MFVEQLVEEPLTGITLVYGPAASGKSTLALEAMRGRSVVLTSGSNFSSERLALLTAQAPELLAKLVLFTPTDLLEWHRSIGHACLLARSAGTIKADCIIIDSFAGELRRAHKRAANLALHEMLTELTTVPCPVFITSEVFERAARGGELSFIGGDMMRLAARTIIELNNGVATVKKHPVHVGREWEYIIKEKGIIKK